LAIANLIECCFVILMLLYWGLFTWYL
jgi:hypothetical protein